jgi:hypothetical protein
LLPEGMLRNIMCLKCIPRTICPVITVQWWGRIKNDVNPLHDGACDYLSDERLLEGQEKNRVV